jgi:hypothetical protein
MMAQSPESKPRPYRRYYGPRRIVAVSLHLDAWTAVQATMRAHGLSASGAVHHLVRSACGLEALN